jgi:putative intracellular protease/amidase
MPSKALHLYVFPGFADWEPAHALAELRRHGQYRVEVVSRTLDLVESMGGVRVQPTRLLSDVDPAEVAAFILPGGDAWESGEFPDDLRATLARLDAANVPIAAICAATLAVVRSGILRGRSHTSNGLSYLKHYIPSYDVEKDYRRQPAVRDRGLITASGLADIEFARELMEELEVLSPADRAVWSDMFRGGQLPAELG